MIRHFTRWDSTHMSWRPLRSLDEAPEGGIIGCTLGGREHLLICVDSEVVRTAYSLSPTMTIADAAYWLDRAQDILTGRRAHRLWCRVYHVIGVH